MIVFPHCKINLGLHVISKRKDGYHNLESIFYPLALNDVLEIIPSPSFRMISSGFPIPGDPADNLCVKAFNMLRKDFSAVKPVEIQLFKKIPAGAGLGGGSSDGAFMLKLLNRYFKLGLSQKGLQEYALRLGSDCPFFMSGAAAFVTGRGDIVETLDCDLSGYAFLLLQTGIHIDTAWAFSKITPVQPRHSIKDIVQAPVETWKDALKNDFEEPVFKAHPLLKEIREKLYEAGALYASMSGSGSVIYGIFKKDFIPDLKMGGSVGISIIEKPVRKQLF